jgi:hypothetical protein
MDIEVDPEPNRWMTVTPPVLRAPPIPCDRAPPHPAPDDADEGAQYDAREGERELAPFVSRGSRAWSVWVSEQSGRRSNVSASLEKRREAR